MKSNSDELRDAAARWLLRKESGFSETEAAAFSAWIAADPRHAAMLSQLETTWSALDRPRAGRVSGEVLARLSVIRRRRRTKVASTLAVVAMTIVLVIWNVRPSVPTAHIPSSAVVLVPERHILPDGSRVELNTDARISVAYNEQVRQVVLLHGQAHFQVNKDAVRPFVVSAGQLNVRAVGTAFSVTFDSKAVEVLVTEGLVSVSDDQPSALPSATEELAPAPIVTLDVGKRLVMDLAVSPSAVIKPVVEPVAAEELLDRLAWLSPRLEFTRVPLAEAVALMNQHASTSGRQAVKFVIEDPTLGQEEVSGLFRADRTSTFIRVLENGFGVTATPRAENEIVLTRRSHP